MSTQPKDIDADRAIRLLRDGGVLVDVRAPIEFDEAAVPGSVNLPLLDTEQRRLVGTTYRHEGSEAAVTLGQRLVGGALRTERVDGWIRALGRGPEHAVMCARGGLRSRFTAEWLAEAGMAVPRVTGGYKAIRQRLLRALDEIPETLSLVVVHGRTGTGKTEVLRAVEGRTSVIDLERLANHRGSVFGALPGGQPAQATFENALALELLRHAEYPERPILVEAESRLVGNRVVPPAFLRRMGEAPIVVVESTLTERVERIFREYVEEPLRRGTDPSELRDHLDARIVSIGRRLGDERCRMIRRALSEAFAAAPLEVAGHAPWIAELLTGYYDPLYARHLERHGPRIVRTVSTAEFGAEYAAY